MTVKEVLMHVNVSQSHVHLWAQELRASGFEIETERFGRWLTEEEMQMDKIKRAELKGRHEWWIELLDPETVMKLEALKREKGMSI